MRRAIGLILFGLGVLMLVIVPLMRWYAYPRLAVVASEVAEQVSAGDDVTVLDMGAVTRGERQVNRVTDVQSIRKIVPDLDDSTDRVAVWETSLAVLDERGGGAPQDNVLSYFEERVAFDRRTGESVAGYDQRYSPTGAAADRVAVDHEGWYFRLPFDTRPRDYQWWDSAVGQALPLVYDGEDQIDGLAVYRFVQRVQPTPVAEVQAQGRLFGRTGEVVAERVHSVVRTLWVEPNTGELIRLEEAHDSFLRHDGVRGPAVLAGTIASTDEQVAENVADTADRARLLDAAHRAGSFNGLAAGGVFLLAGLALARRSYTGRRAARRKAMARPAPAAPAEPESREQPQPAPQPAAPTASEVRDEMPDEKPAVAATAENTAADSTAADNSDAENASGESGAGKRAAVDDDDDMFEEFDEDAAAANRTYRY